MRTVQRQCAQRLGALHWNMGHVAVLPRAAHRGLSPVLSMPLVARAATTTIANDHLGNAHPDPISAFERHGLSDLDESAPLGAIVTESIAVRLLVIDNAEVGTGK